MQETVLKSRKLIYWFYSTEQGLFGSLLIR